MGISIYFFNQRKTWRIGGSRTHSSRFLYYPIGADLFLLNFKAKLSKNEGEPNTLPKKKNASENVPKCVGANDGKSTLHLQAFLVFRCFPHLRGPPRSCRNVSGGRNALWSARRGTFFRGCFGAEVKKNGRFHW